VTKTAMGFYPRVKFVLAGLFGLSIAVGPKRPTNRMTLSARVAGT